MKGEIVSVHKTGCYVKFLDKNEQHFCLLSSSLEDRPVVNDVVILQQREDKFFIQSIEERKNYVARYDAYKDRFQGFAANIDTAFIVTSANREFSENRIKRFLTMLDVDGQEIRKMIVLTKIDLTDNTAEYLARFEELRRAVACGDQSSIEILPTNALHKPDVRKLLKYFKNTALLMGGSGVGKSTILNTLLNLDLKTREVLADRLGNKGKHTTSARTMYYLDDGRKIIDTPGVKIVGIEGESFSRR